MRNFAYTEAEILFCFKTGMIILEQIYMLKSSSSLGKWLMFLFFSLSYDGHHVKNWNNLTVLRNDTFTKILIKTRNKVSHDIIWRLSRRNCRKKEVNTYIVNFYTFGYSSKKKRAITLDWHSWPAIEHCMKLKDIIYIYIFNS